MLGVLDVLKLAAGAAIGAAIGYTAGNVMGQGAGYDRALIEIAAQDNRAVGRAEEFRLKRRYCVDGGGVWSQSSGECVGR